jgi:hypothetical protein
MPEPEVSHSTMNSLSNANNRRIRAEVSAHWRALKAASASGDHLNFSFRVTWSRERCRYRSRATGDYVEDSRAHPAA